MTSETMLLNHTVKKAQKLLFYSSYFSDFIIIIIIIILKVSDHNLALFRPRVVSYTLRKNRVLGMESLDSKIVPRVAMSSFFTAEFIPPIETTSAYAAGSLFPPNDMATDPLSMTITNWKNNKTPSLSDTKKKSEKLNKNTYTICNNEN